VTPSSKDYPTSTPVQPMEKASIACFDTCPCNTLDVSGPLPIPLAMSPDAGLARPNLEVVHFPTGSALVTDSAPQSRAAVVDDGFVTMSQGSTPDHIPVGHIPSSPSVFLQQLSRPSAPTPLLSSLTHHKSCKALATGTVPRQSSRLVKKAQNRAPVMAATQNVLMRKLDLASSTHIETDDFNRYLQLFNQGLSEDQDWHKEDLFMARQWP
jgi:hypothetical protein